MWLLNRPTAPEVYRGYIAFENVTATRSPFVQPDSLAVKIVSQHAEYRFHYQWQDTLVLYGNFAPDALLLQYDATGDAYTLRVDQQMYPIRRSDTVQPLQ